MLLRLAVLSCCTISLFAMFVGPSNAPVERIIANISAFIKDHPAKADGYYSLARTHYLAYSLEIRNLQYHPGSKDYTPTPYNGFSVGRALDFQKQAGAPPLKPADRERHYEEALKNFRRALELSPNNGLYLLGLACLQDDHGDTESAIATYLAAFDAALPEESKATSVGPAGIHAFSAFEAGTGYTRLVRKRGVKPAEQATLARVEAGVAKLQKLPMGPITPVVLSLDPLRTRLADLLAPGIEANFDLDGTGRAQRYPWLKPDAALLVWDPERTGAVTSGRQLFGTVTWWMFWENGYRALDSLDDNRDGKLSGSELRGLALWFDRNQNGRCDPGEVVPIEDTLIESIATSFTGRDGDSLVSTGGLRLEDGRTLPTWDWIAAPIAPRLVGSGNGRLSVGVGRLQMKP
ncbi:MAG: hypothetical protein ABI823_19660 [Bryobacteraceae bacterium]